MQQVIICVGISGSGKSTFSTSVLKPVAGAVRINRDSIREMLVPGSTKDPGYYKRLDLFRLEMMVSKIEDTAFQAALEQRRDIIIDNTNLSQKYIAHWLFEAGEAEVKFKLFDCDVTVAKQRILWRDFMTVVTTHKELSEDTRLHYIDKQVLNYHQIKEWILKEHKDKII